MVELLWLTGAVVVVVVAGVVVVAVVVVVVVPNCFLWFELQKNWYTPKLNEWKYGKNQGPFRVLEHMFFSKRSEVRGELQVSVLSFASLHMGVS